MRYAESINLALHDLMQTDDRVFVLGEDILDPYGGAFKVTRGLSTKFPDRVLTTPISEAAHHRFRQRNGYARIQTDTGNHVWGFSHPLYGSACKRCGKIRLDVQRKSESPPDYSYSDGRPARIRANPIARLWSLCFSTCRV